MSNRENAEIVERQRQAARRKVTPTPDIGPVINVPSGSDVPPAEQIPPNFYYDQTMPMFQNLQQQTMQPVQAPTAYIQPQAGQDITAGTGQTTGNIAAPTYGVGSTSLATAPQAPYQGYKLPGYEVPMATTAQAAKELQLRALQAADNLRPMPTEKELQVRAFDEAFMRGPVMKKANEAGDRIQKQALQEAGLSAMPTNEEEARRYAAIFKRLQKDDPDIKAAQEAQLAHQAQMLSLLGLPLKVGQQYFQVLVVVVHILLIQKQSLRM